MPNSADFVRRVTGRLLPVGPVTARRMFGGHGVFLEGVMFGLISRDALYFKTDSANIDDYILAGESAFTYRRGGREISLSYHRVPLAVAADGEVLSQWAERALAAARRGRKTSRRGR